MYVHPLDQSSIYLAIISRYIVWLALGRYLILSSCSNIYSALKDVQVPPGPRLLILEAVHRRYAPQTPLSMTIHHGLGLTKRRELYCY